MTSTKKTRVFYIPSAFVKPIGLDESAFGVEVSVPGEANDFANSLRVQLFNLLSKDIREFFEDPQNFFQGKPIDNAFARYSNKNHHPLFLLKDLVEMPIVPREPSSSFLNFSQSMINTAMRDHDLKGACIMTGLNSVGHPNSFFDGNDSNDSAQIEKRLAAMGEMAKKLRIHVTHLIYGHQERFGLDRPEPETPITEGLATRLGGVVLTPEKSNFPLPGYLGSAQRISSLLVDLR